MFLTSMDMTLRARYVHRMASDKLVDKEVLGRLIRAARIAAGYESVADAATAIRNNVGDGMSDRTLYAIERGEQSVTLDQFMAILMTFNAPSGPFFYFNAYRQDLQEFLRAGATYQV